MSNSLDWTEVNRDVKTLGSISYSEATYLSKVPGGILYRVDWFVCDIDGHYLDSGKTVTFAPKATSKIREFQV
jgi:hypothetical protein